MGSLWVVPPLHSVSHVIILYVFFFIFPRRLIVVCRHFGTTSYPAYEDGTDRVFRNVGIYNSDAGELPQKKT